MEATEGTDVTAYYNDNDPYCAQWLRNLIAKRLIAAGDVDERSIKEVQADDLKPYTQCHFFAGIGGWSHALRLASWPDDRPVWTGSCPCQPFWPEWFRLIRNARPPTIFGEQVASKDGLSWLDLVSTDLESEGFAVGAADLCAAGAGAPHIRQRLWFVAVPSCEGLEERECGGGVQRETLGTQEGQTFWSRVPVLMASSGLLNPEFSRWLMGFPPEWLSCAPSAMRSSRKSRQSS